ncbi:MAG TPA: glycosyltransferase family 1 protein [Acidimicrobiales bacterium]|nr:glycosyltransferase family 1 protein [Acidimicrobiales bacterium]
MSTRRVPARSGRPGRTPEVLLVVEQLRRRVPGGIGTYVAGLLAGLAALAPEAPSVALLASRPASEPDPLERFGFPVVASSLPGRLLTRAWARGLGRERVGAGVVHATSLAVPPTDRPLVVTVHDLAWRALPAAFPRRGRRWHEAALRRAARRAARLVVPSEAVRDALLDAGLGLEPADVAVVEEGADHLPPPDRPAAAALLGRLGVRGPYLLSAGTLEPRKNLARLVRAYGAVRDLLPEPWPLVVAGPAGWGRGVPPAPGVVLAGRVDDAVLAALYEGARLFCYVPLLEGFGLPVVEAMRAGTPVVASPVPAAGGAAHLVDPLDVEAIAEGLRAVALDEALRRRLVEAGRSRVAGLTWRSAAAAHVAQWEAVRARGTRGR